MKLKNAILSYPSIVHTRKYCFTCKESQKQSRRNKTSNQRLGGKLHSFWFAFGEYDVVLLAEFPNNANVAAVVLAAFGAGGLKGIKTTPLLSIEKTMDALTKASNARYQPPTKTGIQVPA